MPRRGSKVERLIEERGLDGLGDELERRWLGRGDDQLSLRDLAEHFNERLLEQRMREGGMEILAGDVENLHRLLTDEDVSEGMRQQARNRLQRHDIDVDQLEADFVSFQAIYTYLTKYRGVDRSDAETTADDVDRARETLQRLESRTRVIAEDRLSRLRKDETLTLGEFDIFIDIDVYCSECGSSYDIYTLLDRGECGCS